MPSKPTPSHKPLKRARTPKLPKPIKKPDRFAQYVNDWSEEEEAAFELGMQMRREREAWAKEQ